MHLVLQLCLVLVMSLAPRLVIGGTLDASPARGLIGDGQLAPIEEGGCGKLVMNSDGTYEGGFGWTYGGVVPPEYGAFAECYSGDASVCAVTLDLTGIGGEWEGRTMDVFVWEDHAGIPGSVLCMVSAVNPGPVALWPAISRHTVELPEPCQVPTAWWVGYWGDWQDDQAGWYIAADTRPSPLNRAERTYSLGNGCPLTKIAPGLGYPTGWQDVSMVWGPTHALGIGAEIVTPTPIRETSWGRVKQIYQPNF